MTFLKDSSQELNEEPLARTEIAISYVLRYGVLICSILIFFGLSLKMISNSGRSSSLQTITALTTGQSLLAHQMAPSTLINGLTEPNPDSWLTVGLLFLIALPILRVGMTVFVFLFARDWAFLAITLIVFSVLISGIIFGRAL